MATPIVRISRGRFAPENYQRVKQVIDDSARPLVPAIRALTGLIYYHAAVDPETSTVVNVSIWDSMDAAKQMDSLAPMLVQRRIVEGAGVTFDKIANYAPLWKIEAMSAA
jgi:quinol monooxygenase YgiN